MTFRVAQPSGTPSSMRPRAEALASAVQHRALRPVPVTAQLFQFSEKILVGGGGSLLEVNVDLPPQEWPTRSIPDGIFGRDPDGGNPLLIASSGAIYRLQPDLLLQEIYRVEPLAGGAAAFALSDGRVVIGTVGGVNSSTCLLDAAGRTTWRVHCTEPVLAAFEDVLFAVDSIDPGLMICRDTATGAQRWKVKAASRGAAELLAVVDNRAWFFDGTALVALDVQDGAERARLTSQVISSTPRVDPQGRAHWIFGFTDHWLVDLRAGTITSRLRYTGGPLSAPYPMQPLDGAAVLVRDRTNSLYRLPSGDGIRPWPAPLWKANSLPVTAVVHRNGLVVLTDPAKSRKPATRTVHWLQQA